MTAEQMSESVATFLMEANRLQWKKNKDYHPDDVAFLEILRTACETGISVEQDLWAKIRKQYVALRGYFIDGQYESEPPRSRMTDIAVYMGMSAFWDIHKEQIVADALTFVNNHTRCENGRDMCCGELNTVVPICDRCRFQFWLDRRVNTAR